MRSTTLITRTLRSGSARSRSTAASVSSVGTSPQQAEHDVGFAAAVGARPLPDAHAGGAMAHRLVHREPHRRRLLARDDDVHVVAAAQAVVGHAEQAVRVGRQIDANHLRLLVDDVIDEAGVLVREAVVVLAPDVRAQEVIERGDRRAPRNVVADLEPLRVLVEHRVDDVDERLVAAEEAVAPREQIPFEPALALMLGQHLHHAAVGREVIVGRQNLRHVAAIRDVEHVLPAIGVVLVGAEQAKVARRQIGLHHVAQELAHHARGLRRRLRPARAPSLRSSRKSGMRRSRSSRPPLACGLSLMRRSPCGASAASSATSLPSASNSSSGTIALHPPLEDPHVARRLSMSPIGTWCARQ